MVGLKKVSTVGSKSGISFCIIIIESPGLIRKYSAISFHINHPSPLTGSPSSRRSVYYSIGHQSGLVLNLYLHEAESMTLFVVGAFLKALVNSRLPSF